jgi:hypothetical protein
LEAHGVTHYNCYKYTLVLLPLHSTLVLCQFSCCLQKTGSVMFPITTSWQLANKMCNICVHVCVCVCTCICMHVHKHTTYVQKNSFNLTSDSLEILINQHLRRVVPRFEVLLVTRKTSFINETADFRDMFNHLKPSGFFMYHQV